MLTTLEQVKAYLIGVAAEPIPPAHDDIITHLIKRQSRAAEQFCRRRLTKLTWTSERHTGELGQTEFSPDHWPINAVTSVSIDGTAVVEGTAASNYVLLKNTDGETWALYREDGWKSDPHKLLITYISGYVLTTPTGTDILIPDDLEGAVRELSASAYLQRGKAGLARESFEGLSLDFDRWPSHIVQALSKYQRPRI